MSPPARAGRPLPFDRPALARGRDPAVTSQPTLREVALVSGVSIKTVSRVINGDDNVAAATAARVNLAVSELRYSPNLVARSLRRGRDNAIALVVASISDPFFAEVTAAVEETGRSHGYFVIISCTGEGDDAERAVVNGLLTRQVAGLVLVPTASSQAYLAHRPPSLPVVCVDRPAVGADCDAVLVDNEQASFAATQWLISHGHRRIALVGGPSDKYTIKGRRLGYQRALRHAGIPVDPDLTGPSAVLPTEAADVVPRLLALEDPVTAILTSNSKASLGVVGVLHSGRRTDIAMVGFDDFPMAAALVPPVTVVSQDPWAIGRQAAELLMRRITGDAAPTVRLVLPTSLVVRGSGELRPLAISSRRAPVRARRVAVVGPRP